MAGCTAKTSDRLHAVVDRSSGKLSLHLMFSIKSHPVPVSIRLVQAEGHHTLKLNRCLTVVFHADTSCDDIQVFHNSIVQFYSDILHIITKSDHESLCLVFVCIHCRKSRNGIFSLDDLIAFIAKSQSSCSIIIADIECTLTIVSASKRRIFLRQSICGVCPVPCCLVRISGKTVISSLDQIGVITNVCFSSIVGVKQDSFVVRFHLVHAVLCAQGEQSVFFVKYDCHRCLLLLISS